MLGFVGPAAFRLDREALAALRDGSRLVRYQLRSEFDRLLVAGLYKLRSSNFGNSVIVLVPASAGHSLVIVDQQRLLARFGGEESGACAGRAGSDYSDFVHVNPS
ncbi:hypothetical protein D3C71_1850360 [compost metagenome]